MAKYQLKIKKPAERCSDNGYVISNGARSVTNDPDNLPFGLITNGLEIITERQVFYTGENGIEELMSLLRS